MCLKCFLCPLYLSFGAWCESARQQRNKSTETPNAAAAVELLSVELLRPSSATLEDEEETETEGEGETEGETEGTRVKLGLGPVPEKSVSPAGEDSPCGPKAIVVVGPRDRRSRGRLARLRRARRRLGEMQRRHDILVSPVSKLLLHWQGLEDRASFHEEP